MAHLGGYDGPSCGLIAPCLVLAGMSKTQTALKSWRAQKPWKIHEKWKVLATILALLSAIYGAMLAPLEGYVALFWRL